MLFGIPPFYTKSKNQDTLFKIIIQAEIKFPSIVKLSKECKDFIKKLTIKNKKKRLGSKGGS